MSGSNPAGVIVVTIPLHGIYHFHITAIHKTAPRVVNRIWLSLVERLVWDQEVAGSNPAIRTIACSSVGKNSHFIFVKSQVQILSSVLSFLLKRNFYERRYVIIKLISKRDLKVLIDNGYADASTLRGITVTSKNKNSRGKRYYAKDVMAFTAWYLSGLNPDDKDFQNWKRDYERSSKRKITRKQRDN